MPTIERDGLEIHYQVKGEGRVLLLLHGFLFSGEMWADQVDLLSRDYRVITVDFRGHGRSSTATESFTLYDLVSDVVAVLDACHTEKAVWIGLSMGGMVAMRAAVVVPEAVESLVLLDTSSEREPALNRFRYRVMVTAARLFGMKPFIPIIGSIVFGSSTRRSNSELVDRWKESFSNLELTSVRNGLEAVIRRDTVTPLLHEIDVPTFVIVGGEDVATPPTLSETIAEGIGGARLQIIPGAGHMTNLERPEIVNELILEFLRSSLESEAEAETTGIDRDMVEPEGPGEDVAPEAPAADEIAEPGEPGEQQGVANAELAPEGEEVPEVAEPDETKADEEPDSGGVGDELAAATEESDVSVESGSGEAALEGESAEARESAEGAEPGELAASPEEDDEDLDVYTPDEDEIEADREVVLPGGKKGSERRGKRRVSPSRKLYGRVGHVGVLLVDVSESGARIEHYNRRFQTGSTILLEIEWETRSFRAECQVVSSRVHRFIPGDKGATVYQSGVLFRRMNDESKEVLKELVGRLVTRGLAEQVANARGIGPVLQRDMPTFRSGVVNAGGRPKEAGSEGPSRLIKENPLTDQTGYIRCRKVGARWERKWTLDPEQPREGFTILASENKLEIDMLCETWDTGDAEARRFIRDCARMSIKAAASESDQSS